MAKKKSITELLAEHNELTTHPDMNKWANALDRGEHGAKAAARHIRLALAAAMKSAKALRATIMERKPA